MLMFLTVRSPIAVKKNALLIVGADDVFVIFGPPLQRR